MAGKPRSAWSDSYRKRIERAEAKGLTRQQARGHTPPPGQSEHRARVRKEIRLHGISGDQLRTVRSYAERRARKNKNLHAKDLVDWAQQNGWRQFKRLRQEQGALASNYRSSKSKKPLQTADEFNASFHRPGRATGMGGGGGDSGRDMGSRPNDYAGDYSDDGGEEPDDLEDFDYDDEYLDLDDLDIEWMYYHDS